MKVYELRTILDQYDGEMDVVIWDEERNVYNFVGIEMDIRDKEPTLALKGE